MNGRAVEDEIVKRIMNRPFGQGTRKEPLDLTDGHKREEKGKGGERESVVRGQRFQAFAPPAPPTPPPPPPPPF